MGSSAVYDGAVRILFLGNLLLIFLVTGCASSKPLSKGPAHDTNNKEVAIRVEDVTLSVPREGLSSPDAIQVRRVQKNDLTEYYATTAMELGAGPSVDWSVEIESQKKISVPMELAIHLPLKFIEGLGSKYEPKIFYYCVDYGANNEEIGGIASIPSSFDQSLNIIHVTIEPSRSWEFFRKNARGEGFLMMMIVGSSPQK